MQKTDRWLRERFGGDWLPPIYRLWLAALVAFVAADVVALLCA